MIRSTSSNVPYHVEFSNGEHRFIADVPRVKGGQGNGFGPHELLEAALATCITMTVQMYAAKHEIPLTGAGCEVNIDRSVPGAVALEYDLQLDGPLSESQLNDLRVAAGKCPVARTLTGSLAIRSKG